MPSLASIVINEKLVRKTYFLFTKNIKFISYSYCVAIEAYTDKLSVVWHLHNFLSQERKRQTVGKITHIHCTRGESSLHFIT